MDIWVYNVVFVATVSAVINPPLAPDVWVPMDVIDNGVLNGRDYNAALVGSPQLVPAVFGNGLQLNMGDIDQIANFGNLRHTCFGNPEKCSDGFTFSVWLYLGTPRGHTMYLISSGGQTMYSFGVVLYHRSDSLYFSLRTNSAQWTVSSGVSNLMGQWMHVMLIWHAVDGSKMYFNGELVAETNTFITNAVRSNSYNDLVLGASNRGSDSASAGVCLMDDLRIWYRVLDSREATEAAQEGFLRLDVTWLPLSIGEQFIIYPDDHNATTCTQLQTQGRGPKASLVEVIWLLSSSMIGLETITVQLSGGFRQDSLSAYVSNSLRGTCMTLLYPCELQRREVLGYLWNSFYTCSCPSKDCSRVFLDLGSAQNECQLTWTFCEPLLICSVTLVNT